MDGDAPAYTYRWRWRQTKYGPLAPELQERFGDPCRVFVRSRASIGVEFADGYRVVTMRWAVAAG